MRRGKKTQPALSISIQEEGEERERVLFLIWYRYFKSSDHYFKIDYYIEGGSMFHGSNSTSVIPKLTSYHLSIMQKLHRSPEAEAAVVLEEQLKLVA